MVAINFRGVVLCVVVLGLEGVAGVLSLAGEDVGVEVESGLKVRALLRDLAGRALSRYL